MSQIVRRLLNYCTSVVQNYNEQRGIANNIRLLFKKYNFTSYDQVIRYSIKLHFFNEAKAFILMNGTNNRWDICTFSHVILYTKNISLYMIKVKGDGNVLCLSGFIFGGYRLVTIQIHLQVNEVRTRNI